MIVGKYRSENGEDDVLVAYQNGLRTIVRHEAFETITRVTRVHLDQIDNKRSVGECVEKSHHDDNKVFKKVNESCEKVDHNDQNYTFFVDIDEYAITHTHKKPDHSDKLIRSTRFKFYLLKLQVFTRIRGGELVLEGEYSRVDQINRRWCDV